MSVHRFVPAAVAACFALITVVPAADAKPNAKPKVKPATAHSVKTTKSHGPKTTAKPTTASVKTHGNGSQAKAVKPTTSKGTGKTKTATADLAKGSSQKVKGDKSTRTAVNDTTTTRGDGSRSVAGTELDPTISTAPTELDPTISTAPPTDPTFSPAPPLSKAQQQILKNDNLRAKLLSRLPPGTNAITAASGFRNLGQYVAAVNVSHNQGINFVALKALMVGPQSMSLGQAIQQLKGVSLTTANTTADTALTTANRELSTSTNVSTTKPKTKRNNRG